MRRLGTVWLIFGLCVALASGAMARLGSTVLALERAESRARRQAELEGNLQLALWRMDSTLAPLLAEESARPYFAYSSFYPAERAFTRMFAEIQRGDVLIPSPLLKYTTPQVRLHFQFGPDGRLSSPSAPVGNMRDLAEVRCQTPERVERASGLLEELARLVSRDRLAAALPAEAPASGNDSGQALVFEQGMLMNQQMGPSKDSNEFAARSRSSKIAQNAGPSQALPLKARSPVSQGPLQAVWIGSELVLARRVKVEEGTFFQGCWLDWNLIRRELLEGVVDLVPIASLEPVDPSSSLTPTRMLASLPVRLVPGPIPEEPESRWSPARLSLGIAWSSLAIAAIAVALVLRGALVLSERRGTFVSAVTHELRTPLTTFRLYTEMLDEGMVPGVDSQRSYFRTLRLEADRLGHLVQNVLSFARLEHGRAAENREVVEPAELLDRLVPRLKIRAQQAGMEFVSNPTNVDSPVRVDLSVVDQILSNLVDNAIKYAGSAEDRRIHLDVEPSGRGLALIVRDHGPGLQPRVIRKLFRPFSKSADDAAHSAPGVGLGLALSRRLARAQGGDLRLLENGPQGASFAVTIPAV
jgi:signal transduction histidine kinase